MSKHQRISLGFFTVIAIMSAVAIVVENDWTVRYAIAALLTAYGGLTFHIVSSEDQARVRQRQHDELIAALKEIRKK